jgi:hypothetical protein
MKKVIWIIVALAVGGYFINSCIRTKAKGNAEAAETKRIEEATKSAISAMVSRTGAVDDWAQTFEVRLGRIFTIELERLWLQNRPILFVGAINDIANYDESHYVVLVGGGIGSLLLSADTKLKLSLLATKSRIDSFLKEHPDLFEGLGLCGVAVVATIRAIKTENIAGKEGGGGEWKVGEGELVDMVFCGNMLF